MNKLADLAITVARCKIPIPSSPSRMLMYGLVVFNKGSSY